MPLFTHIFCPFFDGYDPHFLGLELKAFAVFVIFGT